MLTFLLVIQAIVAVLLVGVILMQQSEGGGLGMGGSPSGLMSARGAADFMTRATTILAAIFIALSILHAVLATQTNRGGDIDTSLAKKGAPTAPPPANPSVPIGGAPATGVPAPVPVPGPVPGPTSAPGSVSVPIATAQPKAQPKVQPRTVAPRTQPGGALPVLPPVSSNVPSITPSPAAPTAPPVQGPPANSN